MGSVRNYKIRYSVESWNKPVEGESVQKRPGIRVNNTDYGYTDQLFLVSIVGESVLMLDSLSGGPPMRETLLMVRDQIDHYLEHHAG